MMLQRIRKTFQYTFWHFLLLILAGMESASAKPLQQYGWDVDATRLLLPYPPEESAGLLETLSNAEPILCSLEISLPAKKLEKILVVQYHYGYDKTWLLYRFENKPVVALIYSEGKARIHGARYHFADADQWNSVFQKFFMLNQRPPTPALDGKIRLLPVELGRAGIKASSMHSTMAKVVNTCWRPMTSAPFTSKILSTNSFARQSLPDCIAGSAQKWVLDGWRTAFSRCSSKLRRFSGNTTS